MKLLFDENLSFRLVCLLADIYPESRHVRDIGLMGADDARIWQFAKENNYLLVSKDADFYERSVLFGAPPKVVWLKIGDCTVTETAIAFRKNQKTIEDFYHDDTATFFVLDGRLIRE